MPLRVSGKLSKASTALVCATVAATAIASVDQPLQPAGKSAPPDGDALVTPRLALPRAALVPGESTLLAIIFDIEPGWHLYWMNPGDTGMGPLIDLTLPEGITQTGELLWPFPARYQHSGFMVDNIYEDELVLLAPLAVAPDLTQGDALNFAIDIEWLVCADICLAGAGSAALSAPVASPQAQPATTTDAQRIRAALSRVPAPAAQAADLGVAAVWKGSTLVIEAAGADSMTYFHNEPRNAPPRDIFNTGSRAGDSLRLPFPRRIAEHDAATGVVVFTRGGQERAVWISASAPKTSALRN